MFPHGTTYDYLLFHFQVITVYSGPGLDSDWMIGERGSQRGKVPLTYLELLN